MQHQDKTSDNCTTDECQLSRCCWCFWTRRDETRQLQKADCVEISGSGRQVADRHVCDQGEREGISTRTERLWSGCGRPAATGHIVPMAHSWTSMSSCQVSKRSPVGTPRCWYRLLAVYINRRLSGESVHCYHFRVPPPPNPPHAPLHQFTGDNTKRMIDSCVLMRQHCSQETVQEMHTLSAK